jgi:WD40 repeat protein
MTAGWCRRALTIGVSAFHDADEQAEAIDGELPDLPFAPGLAGELAAALEGLGYSCTTCEVERLTSAELGSVVADHVGASRSEEVLVVHVLSHGQAGDGDATVYVLGSDGTPHHSTDVAHWLTTTQNVADRPPTLFLLDLCQSGNAARFPWQMRIAEDRARAWVLAACEHDQAAYDGRFTRAVTTVLRAVANGDFHIDPGKEFVPLEVVARAVRQEVHRLAAEADGYRQQVTGSMIDISADVELPFFPNPACVEHSPGQALRAELDDGLLPFLDDLDVGLDARHFVDRGAGLGALAATAGMSELIGLFTGRERELKRLSPWLNRVGPGGLAVVTGSAGVGKSALLGVLVCAAHPTLRGPTQAVWDRVAQPPLPVEDGIAAVHARQRSLATILTSLAHQLGVDVPPTAEELIAALCEFSVPPVIVIDALDEADDGATITAQLLTPLAAARRGDGQPAVRVLVGTRPYAEYAPLLEVARQDGLLIDLDEIPRNVVEIDLNRYVYELLGATEQYRNLGAVRGAFATKMAQALAVPPTRPADQRWGEFLVAGVYTRYFLTAHKKPITDPVYAERLGAEVPGTLPEVLELDLSTAPDRPWLRPILAGLAHALGQGMPAAVLARAAAALTNQPATGPSATEFQAALEIGRFYLRQATDTDGSVLYRLFHQGLADYLRQHPLTPHERTGREQAEHLLDWLLEPLGPPAQRDWAAAEPYLLRHALQHAVNGRHVDDLLNDPGFLLIADPEVVDAARANHDSADVQRILAVLHATPTTSAAPLDQRAAALALNATRAGLTTLAGRAANLPEPPLTWQPRWTAGTPDVEPAAEKGTSTAFREPMTGHEGAVLAVAYVVVNDIPVAVTGGADRTVRLWNLEDGQQIGGTLTGHAEPVRAVACAVIDNSAIAITGSADESHYYGTVRFWDLEKRRELGILQTGGVSALAYGLVGGRRVIATIGSTARLWDFTTRKQIGKFVHLGALTDGHGVALASDDQEMAVVAAGSKLLVGNLRTRQRITRLAPSVSFSTSAVACTVVDGTPIAVTGTDEGTVRLWDLGRHLQIGGPLTGHKRRVHAVACTVIDGTPVAVTAGKDGTVRLWDLERRRQVGEPLTGHGGPVNAVACALVGDIPVAVTGGKDGTVRTWALSLTTDVSETPEARNNRVRSAALPALRADGIDVATRHLKLSGDRRTLLAVDDHDRAVALDLATGAVRHEPLGVDISPVTAVDEIVVAGRLVAVLSDPLDATRLWDHIAGRLVDGEVRSGRTEIAPPAVATTAIVDGVLVAVTGHVDGSLRVRRVTATTTLDGHDGPVTAVAATELSGQVLLFSGGADGTVRVWDLESGRRLDVLRVLGPVSVVEATTDGHLLVGAAGEIVNFRSRDGDSQVAR